MHCFFHITCLLLLTYFLVKLFFIINNGLFNFLLSCHIPCLDDLILANVNDEIHILKKIRKWFDQSRYIYPYFLFLEGTMQECLQSRHCTMIYKILHLTLLVEQCVYMGIQHTHSGFTRRHLSEFAF